MTDNVYRSLLANETINTSVISCSYYAVIRLEMEVKEAALTLRSLRVKSLRSPHTRTDGMCLRAISRLLYSISAAMRWNAFSLTACRPRPCRRGSFAAGDRPQLFAFQGKEYVCLELDL